MKKPPYVIENKSGFYWQPRGRMAEIWPPGELGKDKAAAYAKGWYYYSSGRSELQPSNDGPKEGSVKWGVVKWQDSDDYTIKANGQHKKPNTIRAQDMGCKVIEAELGRNKIELIQRRHAKGWYKELRDDRGDSMAASVMRTTRALFAFFHDQGYRDDNPFLKMRLHVPGRNYLPWTRERVRAFFDQSVELDRRRVGTFVLCVYESAQNPSDVLRWRWDQIGGSGLWTRRSKTGAQAFTPLSDWCMSELGELEKQAVQIFVNPATRRPYTYRYMAGEVQRIRKAAELPDELKIGNLRHEAAQEARDGGAGRGDVQSLLAHKSPGTQDFYAEGRDATGAQDARKLWKDET